MKLFSNGQQRQSQKSNEALGVVAVGSLRSIYSGILQQRFLTLSQYSSALAPATENVEAFLASSTVSKTVGGRHLKEAMSAYKGAETIWQWSVRRNEIKIKAAQAAAICASDARLGDEYLQDLVQGLVAAAVYKKEDPSCMKVQTVINALWGFAGMKLQEAEKSLGIIVLP